MPSLKMSDELINLLKSLPDVDLEALIDSYSKPIRESIRVNTLKADEHFILDLLKEKGVVLEKIPWTRYGYWILNEFDIGKAVEHMLGLIYIQGAISMLPVEILSPTLNEVVLDLCAAPGSKTTQIAQYLRNTGVIVANDVSIKRIKALSSNVQRCGVLNCVITLLDGRRFYRWGREMFDKVLVDAPCSSLGIVSKDWSVARRWSFKMSERLSMLQLGLLLSGFDCLKPGGTMVYATCTLSPQENEAVVDTLLKKRPNAKLKKISIDGLRYHKGITEWMSKRFQDELEYCIRIYPYDCNGEGFFIAKILKEG